MNESARQFLCARCHILVYICQWCDRGNIYCGKTCSIPARKNALKAANQRYWRSPRGKLKAALRQKKYRAAQLKLKIVTYQGSPDPPENDVLLTELKETPRELAQTKDTESILCVFCDRTCGDFVRIDFLSRKQTFEENRHLIWPRGP